MNYIRFAKYASAYIALGFVSVTAMMYENAKQSHQEFKWNMIFNNTYKNKQDIEKAI